MTELPDFKPMMFCGLSWKQARANLERVDCAIRREHWCSPVVILHDGKPIIDDDGDLLPFRFMRGDRSSHDWMMVPRIDDDGKVEPVYRVLAGQQK